MYIYIYILHVVSYFYLHKNVLFGNLIDSFKKLICFKKIRLFSGTYANEIFYCFFPPDK